MIEYPCMNDPSPTFHGASHSVSARVLDTPAAHSMRSRRTTSWARQHSSDDGYSRYVYLYLCIFSLYLILMLLLRGLNLSISICSDSVLRRTTSEFKKMGKRIFVFIVGGATRSEVKTFCFSGNYSFYKEIPYIKSFDFRFLSAAGLSQINNKIEKRNHSWFI